MSDTTTPEPRTPWKQIALRLCDLEALCRVPPSEGFDPAEAMQAYRRLLCDLANLCADRVAATARPVAEGEGKSYGHVAEAWRYGG